MTMPRLRPSLEGLPAYKAGQRPAQRPDLVSYKISSNENPYPPLPGVMDAVMRAAADVNRYPDPPVLCPRYRSGSTFRPSTSLWAQAAWRYAASSSMPSPTPGTR